MMTGQGQGPKGNASRGIFIKHYWSFGTKIAPNKER